LAASASAVTILRLAVGPERGLCQRPAQAGVSVELRREAAQLVAQLERRRLALRGGHIEAAHGRSGAPSAPVDRVTVWPSC
jgi:hypothetical protein